MGFNPYLIKKYHQPQRAKMLIARAVLQNNIASAVMCNISPLRAFIMFCLLFAAINLPPVQGYFWCGFLGNGFCQLGSIGTCTDEKLGTNNKKTFYF
jgi:hypothetical protein